MLTAITREVNAAIGSCELTFLPRVNVDTDLARQQHQHFQSALCSLGCEIIIVPTEPGLADSVFIEDTAIVLDEVAVLCRPGATTRQAEVAGVERILNQYRSLASIVPPGTLDGGDLLRIDKVIYAGLSTRSNRSGIKQLRSIVAEYGYSVKTVETAKCLHLKSAVSEVAPGLLLINSDWINKSAFGDYELVEVDNEEAHAANALLLGRSVIYPSSFPRTLEKLVMLGIDVTPVDLSELQKAEGAVTCCALVFATP
ncbi:MAG: dimethylargininase [Proteobacteria bacterium]|nr:dimethylargininase [Pseudomonadota bacterium]